MFNFIASFLEKTTYFYGSLVPSSPRTHWTVVFPPSIKNSFCLSVSCITPLLSDHYSDQLSAIIKEVTNSMLNENERMLY